MESLFWRHLDLTCRAPTIVVQYFSFKKDNCRVYNESPHISCFDLMCSAATRACTLLLEGGWVNKFEFRAIFSTNQNTRWNYFSDATLAFLKSCNQDWLDVLFKEGCWRRSFDIEASNQPIAIHTSLPAQKLKQSVVTGSLCVCLGDGGRPKPECLRYYIRALHDFDRSIDNSLQLRLRSVWPTK